MIARVHWPLLALLSVIFVIIGCANLGILASHFGPLLRIPGIDKVAHVFLYGLLALVACYTWPKQGNAFHRAFYWAPVWVLGFALLEEFSQLFIDARSADLGDVVADIVGVVIATTLFSIRQNVGSRVDVFSFKTARSVARR
ncbi:VanZ family protein [Simiduia litorea]|uniref:VanZ family protein n=1 Tax=Simiduia litorea TaxID=1435348 RepID=UPI0036F3C9A6